MTKWKKITLEECCHSITDGDHQSMPVSECGVPFIIISNIKNNRIDFEDTRFVPVEYYDSLDVTRKAQRGDILYTVKGSFGIPAYVDSDMPFVFQRDIAILKCNNRVNSKFLYYIMKSVEFERLADLLAIGSAQRAITLKTLRGIEILIPEKSEQDRIVEMLSPYDDLIENNQKQIKLLEEAAQRLYKEWFVDLRFPGYEDVQIVDGVPEGWRKVTLSGIADVIMGQSPKSEFYNKDKEGLPFHQGVGSYGNRFVKDDTYSTSYTRIAEAGSILFSVRAPVGRLNITKNKIVIGRGLSAINHKEHLQSFLFYLLKERFFKDDMVGNGSIFASISKNELLGQEFIVPSSSLQIKFDSIVSSIDRRIDNLDAKISLLTEARDRLLPKLMSGEIEL